MNEPRTIFLLGIQARSGTNLLSHLIRLHPRCGLPVGINEDFFLAGARHLEAFAETVAERYQPDWPITPNARAEILRALGRGLTGLLHRDGRHPFVVAKSPAFANLHLFPEIFPGSPLLLLVRDGRDLVDSFVRSFGRDFDSAVELWRDGARRWLGFQERFGEADFHRTVRYEDLVTDRKGALGGIFSFLGLDPAEYDFAAAEASPIMGSSRTPPESSEADGREWQWRMVDSLPGFRPVGRWREWPAERLATFERVAGEELRRLGYA